MLVTGLVIGVIAGVALVFTGGIWLVHSAAKQEAAQFQPRYTMNIVKKEN